MRDRESRSGCRARRTCASECDGASASRSYLYVAALARPTVRSHWPGKMTRHPIKLHRWYGSRNATLRMKRDFIRELIGPIGPPRTRSRRCFSVHTAVCVSQSPIRLRVRASARVGGDTFPPAGGKEKNRRGQPLADRVDRRRAPPPPSSRRRTARGDGFLRSRESRRVISRFKARTRTRL